MSSNDNKKDKKDKKSKSKDKTEIPTSQFLISIEEHGSPSGENENEPQSVSSHTSSKESKKQKSRTPDVVQGDGQSSSSSSSSSSELVLRNNTLDETIDVDYNEDEGDEGMFSNPEFADMAFCRMRETAGSPLSIATDDYGQSDEPYSKKLAAKARDLKRLRENRMFRQKKRLEVLREKGLIDSDAHRLLNWEDLAEAYLDKHIDEAKLVEAQAERKSAVEDRETAQRQLAEQRKAVQTERNTIKELHKMYDKKMAEAVTKARQERDAVFALQNKKIDDAEKNLTDAQQRHSEEKAAIEAKYATIDTQLAYDAATIRTLKQERDELISKYNDLVTLKDKIAQELLALRSGGTSKISAIDLTNDNHKPMSSATTRGSAGSLLRAYGPSQEGALLVPPQARQPRQPSALSTSSHTGGSSAMSPSPITPILADTSIGGMFDVVHSTPSSAPQIQGKDTVVKTALAPIPPEFAKRDLRGVKAKDIKEFRTPWKYHADQGYQTNDWVSFIPSSLHPAIVLLLQALRDKQGQLVHTETEADEWKTWEVFKFLDNILLCVEPQTITVNEQLDSLEQTTFPDSLFTPTALAETMSNYTERLERHGLRFEDVAAKNNKSLVLALDKRISSMGSVEMNLTKRLRNDNGGDVPITLKAYIDLANKIIGEHLHAKRQSDALSLTNTTPNRPYGSSSYQRKTVSAVRDDDDERPDRDRDSSRRSGRRSEDHSKRSQPNERCSGCGNAGHHQSECNHANSTWFNRHGGDYRNSTKGKAYKAKYKHTRIAFRDVAPDDSLKDMDHGHKDYERAARAHSVARGNESLVAARERLRERGRSRSRDRVRACT